MPCTFSLTAGSRRHSARFRRTIFLALALTTGVIIPASAQEIPKGCTTSAGDALARAIHESRITEAGAAPFHLKAKSEPMYKNGPQFSAEIEEYWVARDKFRRTIHSPEFDQTLIVNGSARFERDSSNYLPDWIYTVTEALFDVVPQHSIDQVSAIKTELGVSSSFAPPNEASICELKYFPVGTDGKTTVTWTGYLRFEPRSGRIAWISSTGFDAGFKDYSGFHGKSVARTIETFPPVSRGDVTTKITELSDLSSPDESLFAISDATPPAQQLRTVALPETEYRKLAVSPPPMNWAPVKRKPSSGSLTTYIVTDRDGTVRDCRYIISNNAELADSAVALIKQWHFKPYIVDGVPMQVETTMTFPYETKVEGDQAAFELPSVYFKRGRDLTYPREEGSKPFHLHAAFDGAGPFFGMHGEYDEVWNSPNHWKRVVTMGKTPIAESRVDDDHYVENPPPAYAALIRDVILAATSDFPGFAYFTPDSDWVMKNGRLQENLVTRVAMARIQDDGNMGYPVAFYFDPDGLLRARAASAGIPTGLRSAEAFYYDQFEEFGAQKIPRQIGMTVDGNSVFKFHIDVLEPAQIVPDEVFILPKIKPKDWAFTGIW